MQIIPGNAQHIGSRKEQQDDFGFSDLENVNFVNHGGVLAVVTDGMGGLAQGREASLLAKQTMIAEYEKKSEKISIPRALLNALLVANARVVEMARQAGLEGQIGTTLAAAVVSGNELYWVSVGDSRIYLYRRGELIRLTTDHDYGRQLDGEVALGKLSKAEAQAHPQRQALTSFLGLPFLSEIDQNEEPLILEMGDRILLCSDGLYKTISEKRIGDYLNRHPQASAEDLVEAAIAQGKASQDNVTVAIIAYDKGWRVSLLSSMRGLLSGYKKPILILLTGMVLFGLSFIGTHFYHAIFPPSTTSVADTRKTKATVVTDKTKDSAAPDKMEALADTNKLKDVTDTFKPESAANTDRTELPGVMEPPPRGTPLIDNQAYKRRISIDYEIAKEKRPKGRGNKPRKQSTHNRNEKRTP